MFAGPNGSGKSTIKELLPPQWLGVYVNADDLERELKPRGGVDLAPFAISATIGDLEQFLSNSTLHAGANSVGNAGKWALDGDRIAIVGAEINSYHASILADFIRHRLLASKTSFTFETVMSSPSKIDFLGLAHQAGYRTYLYYVATEDPEINVARVRHRVALGGHPVPEAKIIDRYHRSLGLLDQAVQNCDRAYIFDNSGHERVWIAEATSGNDIIARTDLLPEWFRRSLWDKFETPGA